MMLTIFTPTYNRGHLLRRVYESLCQQNCSDFRWLIVDDGSCDNTAELVSEFVSDQRIAIEYIKKENGGKHTAHNCAVEHTLDEWFLCLDSDDWLAPDAVQVIKQALDRLHKQDCGFVAYKLSSTGKRLSNPLTVDDLHVSIYQQLLQSNGGEFSFVLSSKLLKNYLFPVIPGECFMGECVLYDRLSLAGYSICPLPRVLEICEYQEDGLSVSFYQLMIKNPVGYQIYHAQRIDLAEGLQAKFRHSICYQAFRRLGRSREHLYRGKHRLLVTAAWLPGQLGAAYYILKGNRKK